MQCVSALRGSQRAGVLEDLIGRQKQRLRSRSGCKSATRRLNQVAANPLSELSMSKLDIEDSWNAAHHCMASGEWATFLGQWIRVDLDGNATARDGVRAFRNQGDDCYQQWVLYAAEAPGAEKRSDGLYMKEYKYNKKENLLEDGYFHPFGTKSGPLRTRTLAPSPRDCVTLPFGLPTQEALGAYEKPPPLFGTEIYFRCPGETRSWSGGPTYSTQGEFMTIFYGSEDRLPGVTPEVPFQMEGRQDMPQMRGKLSDDSTDWLTGKWAGVASQLMWQPDGSMEQSEESVVEWSPVLPPGNRLVILPDLFYISCPATLPVGNVGAHGMTIQMGGRTNETTFCRTTMLYKSDGHVDSCTFERFSLLQQ